MRLNRRNTSANLMLRHRELFIAMREFWLDLMEVGGPENESSFVEARLLITGISGTR